ncbi:MAG TPA: hypothetical protein VNB24_03665 [Acidimicrobiales bacterium]|nr:hypothetical protein [Acidimicrobiales bacterium]
MKNLHRFTACAALASAALLLGPAPGVDALRNPLAPPQSASSSTGTTTTQVAGGWQGTPPVVPLSANPDGTFTAVGDYTLNGTLVGTMTFEMSGRFDPATGNWDANSVDVFRGVYLGDNSQGTLTWKVHTWGNFITGANWAEVEIVGGSGDPTFQCSSGRITWDGFANPAASFGGYSGTWVHGCP